MRASALVSSIALAVASVTNANIFQYEDCDGNGSLLLTELDAEWFVDLSGLYLGCADLSYADLSGADLTNANLSGADLSGAFLSYANLAGADLTNANLFRADLTYAYLFQANLGSANLTNAYLFQANLGSANLTNANLSYANLEAAYLLGADLSGADLSGADLTNANLSDANLTGANLSGADLTGANLSGADLTGATGPVGWTTEIADLITGSCCLSSGCTIISDRQCTEIGGIWTEGGSCDDCQPAADDCPADVDGDGTIGFSDVLVILNDWGACP